MTPRKIPYYRMESSLIPFRPIRWQAYAGSRGCVPLSTQTGVSLERPAPGITPTPTKPPEPKPSKQVIKAQKAQERLQENAKSIAAKKGIDITPPEPPNALVLEECKTPPVFDLQDIPDAMEKMGWTISAKLARSWFNRPKHIYNNDPTSIQPIDDSSVTLDWALQFGSVREKYHSLIERKIRSDEALANLRDSFRRYLTENLPSRRSFKLSIEPSVDLRQFHLRWHFQRTPIPQESTLHSNRALTDLTGALANFNIYAAVAKADILCDKYFTYDNKKKLKTLCFDPSITVTHLFAYLKDNYSFSDVKDAEKSQYLGHWNKTGVIITPGGFFHSRSGYASVDRSEIHLLYLTSDGLDFIVDTRKSFFQKHREADIYFPIHNRTYSDWREKHGRGGDFMIYSKPVIVQLRHPINVHLETICAPPVPM